MDSSARDPPPKCHPGTRLTIGAKLGTWLDDYERLWNMIWLHGPAGTGKSAVAQTFAEHCYERGRLGAAFFFSRPNERNKPKTVIPTLAYQLAVHCRGFNAALTDQLAGDPQLLTKAPRIQLKKLIIEPLLTLQTDEREYIREPFMMILDGLDECEGENPQFDFVSMINEAAQLKNLPLLWLICSRPEAHLEYSFSMVAYCGREKLLLDKESRDDADRYLRDELARIKNEYTYSMPKLWPSEDQFNQLSRFTSGLFIFASAGMKYIGDRTYGNPVKQLEKLLSILKLAEAIGANNPLANLDLLYTQTLTDVPEETLPITQRILAHLICIPRVTGGHVIPTQVLCNFMRIDQNGFYSALRKLHSFIAVPPPEDASEVPLRFHHASFQDFLLDHNRSGRFFIEEQKALVDITKSAFFWNTIDIKCFHANDRWNPDHQHRHASLPNLKWVSPDTETDVSRDVAYIAMYCWRVFFQLSDEQDEDLSSCIRDLDFRYVMLHTNPFTDIQDPSDPIVHTEPSNKWDTRLLEYLRTVIGQGHADPAIFPWQWANVERREYAFIGHEEKTTIILITRNQDRHYVYTLNLDKEPSLQKIIKHQDLLVNANWNKVPDRGEKLSMESETNNPLAVLDRFYTQILTDVPEESLPATQKILAYLVCMDQIGLSGRPVQVLCNFLCINKSAFYSTFQNLDLVISLPASEDASKAPLRFRHASFQGFLLDSNRSGRFAIEEKRAWLVIAKTALFWHSIDVTLFHTNDGELSN
ncbi:hypothetical protein P691DRAFT_680450 [Macrolepiota fuliginosa MF-IS2]|uniref:Nephrocystin 3-like N-terminal domain-containing protein n=1 Tax=Macrolepiota fuliginosa MF-IS2 TaxID=1400762 RepID=A0A9P5X408_9AGAR|nr:hypothetical protein P691DRAFT_680450 [Macrolepiota fuliginosa MF-IS2]